MQSLTQIKQLLADHGLAPSRALGQNFLCDRHHVGALVDAAGVGQGSLVVEVGPGTGTLTEELLSRGCEVIACELDRGLVALLRSRLGTPGEWGLGRFTLIEGDCLESKRGLHPGITGALAGRPFRLVANLPYGAASPLMILFATAHHPALAGTSVAPCLGQFVTIQKEVADRLRAGPGGRDYGPMGVLVQATSTVSRLAVLSPACFWPRPKVTSEMVAIRPLAQPRVADVRALGSLCELLFSQRRKQVGTILGRAGRQPALARCPGIAPDARPEQLTIEQLGTLAAAVCADGPPGTSTIS